MSDKPIILFTNDDGIASPGLWAAAEAFADLCEVLVVAPREQQSGMGRSLPVTSEGRIYEQKHIFSGSEVTVYAVDGTPAQAVQHGVLELAARLPSLVGSITATIPAMVRRSPARSAQRLKRPVWASRH